MSSSDRYVPGGRIGAVLNRGVAALASLGVSLLGTRTLAVRGRRTGAVRTVAVNLLHLDGARYLVAPQGHTQWVRNLRAAGGEGELRLGRRREPFRADEVGDDEKVPVLRAYLRKWGWEVGAFFDGVGADAPDERLRAIAPGYPVFRLR